MNINTNTWNRLRYSLYAPVYDLAEYFVGGARRQAMQQLNPKPGERILLMGCGTGLDLDHFPEGVDLVAIDITPAMVEKTRQRGKALGMSLDTRVMNAEQLDLGAEQFDAVVLHLILAVIPDPVSCIKEAARVLKPGGRVSVMDKFVAKGQRPSFVRKLMNLATNFVFSYITRSLEPLVEAAGLRIKEDLPAMLRGMFRTVTAEKNL